MILKDMGKIRHCQFTTKHSKAMLMYHSRGVLRSSYSAGNVLEPKLFISLPKLLVPEIPWKLPGTLLLTWINLNPTMDG